MSAKRGIFPCIKSSVFLDRYIDKLIDCSMSLQSVRLFVYPSQLRTLAK